MRVKALKVDNLPNVKAYRFIRMTIQIVFTYSADRNHQFSQQNIIALDTVIDDLLIAMESRILWLFQWILLSIVRITEIN